MVLTQVHKMESLWSDSAPCGAGTSAPAWQYTASRGDVPSHRECAQGETGAHSLVTQSQKEDRSEPDMCVTPPLDYLNVELRISEYNQRTGLSRRSMCGG